MSTRRYRFAGGEPGAPVRISPHPLNRERNDEWATYAAPTYGSRQNMWRGAVSSHAASALGRNTLPDCSNMWSTIGPETDCAARYATSLQEESHGGEFRPLALGGGLIRQYGGLYPALMGVQEREVRLLAPHLEYPHGNRASFTSQYPAVVGILDQWIRAEYSKGEGRRPEFLDYRTIPHSRPIPLLFQKNGGGFARPADVRVFRACDLFGYPHRRDTHYYGEEKEARPYDQQWSARDRRYA